MDDDSQLGGMVKPALAAAGLGGVAAFVFLPWWVALILVCFFLLLFGGYFLWRRLQARRKRDRFSAAIEAQTAAAPKAISDPNQRAALDKLRQKFQKGLQEFRSRGKDIYKLPWYVFIGEPGSGKSEAIRHSNIEFPAGLQDELQGSGGTVNMDWWFTNRGIILDTAGSMIFNEARSGEAPEWREFLRLLKKARAQCPINGLFLVLSVESLIRDSADTIAQKASRLAQQLNLIQRTLDVRFPVYLLVTKCDLLTGFKEFFDSIDDPLLQHQIFGWSNPEPLDADFRPDLVDQHLRSVSERLRRRRMALLRDGSSSGRLGGDTQQFFASSYQLGKGAAPSRRLDEVDSLFALPDSIMRLAPRLRRYLETIFVAGEWSAKPVFLRGIYFTSSMREGKALDEAIALATGVSLDQLPEERSWDKNRAFFLRDLFYDKVFRESGLVTRATNTLQMLRKRQLLIFGTAGAALLAFLAFSAVGFVKFRHSVGQQADYWKVGAANWKQGEWSPIVTPPSLGQSAFSYAGANPVEGTDKLTLAQYHRELFNVNKRPLATGLFKPMVWMGLGGVKDRNEAQRTLFEASVVRPLVQRTRSKMVREMPNPETTDAVSQHRDALVSLMQLEADFKANGESGRPLAATNATQKAERYLRSFLTYLIGTPSPLDTNLVAAFASTYSEQGWPPAAISGGDHLSNNVAIAIGLENFRKANLVVQKGIANEVEALNTLVGALERYSGSEEEWLKAANASCPLPGTLTQARQVVDERWTAVRDSTNYNIRGPLTSLASRYEYLKGAATAASASAFTNIASELSGADQTSGIFYEIRRKIGEFSREAGAIVSADYEARARQVDAVCVSSTTNSPRPSFEQRWTLYTNVCELAAAQIIPDISTFGNKWERFGSLKQRVQSFTKDLSDYKGPREEMLQLACKHIASSAKTKLESDYVAGYVRLATNTLWAQASQSAWPIGAIQDFRSLCERIDADLVAKETLGQEKDKLTPLKEHLAASRQKALSGIDRDVRGKLRFPVLLNTTGAAMDVKNVAGIRTFLSDLSKLVGDPIWQADTSGSLASLRANCTKYESVINSLVNADGSPAKVEIFFVPPDPAQQDDRNIINIFRYAQIKVGETSSDWQELTRVNEPMRMVEGTIEKGLSISVRKLSTDLNPVGAVQLDTWALLQLIRGNPTVERRDNGTKWRFKVKLPDSGGPQSGYATFEARLTNFLPKKEDWP